MKNHEKPWKTNLEPWKTMKNHEKPWKTMKKHEKPWETNLEPWKNHEKPWKTKLEPWKPWKTMKNQPGTMKNHDTAWESAHFSLLMRGHNWPSWHRMRKCTFFVSYAGSQLTFMTENEKVHIFRYLRGVTTDLHDTELESAHFLLLTRGHNWPFRCLDVWFFFLHCAISFFPFCKRDGFGLGVLLLFLMVRWQKVGKFLWHNTTIIVPLTISLFLMLKV